MFRVRAWGWTCTHFPVVAHAIDEETGKIARARLCPDHREVLGWLHQLRGPVRVTYEAGPTGFGLARAPFHDHSVLSQYPSRNRIATARQGAFLPQSRRRPTADPALCNKLLRRRGPSQMRRSRTC